MLLPQASVKLQYIPFCIHSCCFRLEAELFCTILNNVKEMSELCIYCGEREATTRDHAPPRSFFPKPRPDNLITVPCCNRCNGMYGKDDERIRNLLTSLEETEQHPGIQDQIAEKRNRSFLRKEGRNNVRHILESVELVDVYSPEGIFLGRHPAFDLDQKVMDRFVERMTRALLFHENAVEFVGGQVEWRMAPKEKDFESMSPKMKAFLASAELKEIGDNVFTYVGYYYPGKAGSLWVMHFYGGVELMSIFRERKG